jgi:Glycosyltransferase family 87
MNKVKAYLLNGKFLQDHKLAILLWFGLAIIAIALSFVHLSGMNNYNIFRQVFYHTIHQQNLYLAYPQEYGDVNLYGPIFSFVIAPFALLPHNIGAILWALAGTAFLFYASMQLPVKREIKTAVIILNAIEMMNVASYYQSNASIAGCIILGFVYINKGKDIWALFFIMLASFVKIYGIVGLAFFFFSSNKWKFIVWFFIWSIVFFLLPVTISSWQFVVQSYKDWYNALTHKADKNIITTTQNLYQDISVMGMVRRIFKYEALNNIFIYIPAVILFGLQYLRFQYFSDIRYRLYLLCSVLLMVVIFSTGSESSTYIIAFPAICIWYFLQPASKAASAYFIFAFVLTTLSYSDILTPYVRKHIMIPYSLKALPSFITWLIICWQMYSKQFLKIDIQKTVSQV